MVLFFSQQGMRRIFLMSCVLIAVPTVHAMEWPAPEEVADAQRIPKKTQEIPQQSFYIAHPTFVIAPPRSKPVFSERLQAGCEQAAITAVASVLAQRLNIGIDWLIRKIVPDEKKVQVLLSQEQTLLANELVMISRMPEGPQKQKYERRFHHMMEAHTRKVAASIGVYFVKEEENEEEEGEEGIEE